MTLKKSDLDKQLGLKIGLRMRSAGAPGRYGDGAASATSGDRRAQRKRDAATGLVPFACKLPAALLARLNAVAAAHADGVNGAVAALLEAGLPAVDHDGAPEREPPKASERGSAANKLSDDPTP